jgi:hypothetical protein
MRLQRAVGVLVGLVVAVANALVAVTAGLALLMVALVRAAHPLVMRAAGGLAECGRRVLARLLLGVRRAIPVVWTGLLVAACLGSAALLLASDLSELRSIRTGETTLEHATAGPHHFYLHALAAAAIVALLAGGLVRGRPALLAGIAVSGVGALIVSLALDLPAVLSSGSWPARYEGVSTRPGAGFWLGVAGSILAVLASLALMRDRSRARARARAAHPPAGAQPDTPAIWAT